MGKLVREGKIEGGTHAEGTFWVPYRRMRTVWPIIGYPVTYTSLLGEILTPERALQRLREGLTVKFQVWED
jgi:hypothetical protein